eukprot:4613575-Pleurochrysis_carterae.AAC.4
MIAPFVRRTACADARAICYAFSAPCLHIERHKRPLEGRLLSSCSSTSSVKEAAKWFRSSVERGPTRWQCSLTPCASPCMTSKAIPTLLASSAEMLSGSGGEVGVR